MLKKMTLLALSVAALAVFALPTVASAQLKEGGTNLAVGAEVTATSENLMTVATDIGQTITCELVTLHLKVETNTANVVELSDVGTTTQNCSSPITKPTAGTITLGGGSGLAAGVTFIVGHVCHFAGNISFTYTAGSSTLTIVGIEHLNGNCGRGDMSGDFHLETSNGSVVTVS